jgi:hypothetical protein
MRFQTKWNAALTACLAVSLFFLVYPIFVIRPFRHQGAAELRLALEVLRFRPIAMIAAVVLAAIAASRYWQTARAWWRRTLAVTAAAAVLGFAVLSRVNVYEIMFHPVDRPEFVAATATKLAAAEKVLAVRLGAEARAYPVRSISYHHVVNDRLGGVPIVATY